MILLVRQDSAAEILGIKTYKALANHIGTLSNDYEFSREERRRLIVNGFTNKPIPVSMSAFSHKTDETVKKVINELEECVIGLPSPAKAVGIVDVLRKSKSNNTARMPNDISFIGVCSCLHVPQACLIYDGDTLFSTEFKNIVTNFVKFNLTLSRFCGYYTLSSYGSQQLSDIDMLKDIQHLHNQYSKIIDEKLKKRLKDEEELSF